MTAWPKQRDCDDFYGNPRGPNGTASSRWMASNLVFVPVPWVMVTAWAPYARVRKIYFHQKCSAALSEVLANIWQEAGKKQVIIDQWGMNLFGGSFAFRTMRGSSSLSMHSWGCAIDFDPARNGLGDYTPILTPSHPVALCFKKAGAVHGADWNGNQKVLDERRPDAMHFQFARV